MANMKLANVHIFTMIELYLHYLYVHLLYEPIQRVFYYTLAM